MKTFPNYITKNWQYRLWILFGIVAATFSVVAMRANPVMVIGLIGFRLMTARLIIMRSKWKRQGAKTVSELNIQMNVDTESVEVILANIRSLERRVTELEKR